jgi:hypothetical protein
VCQTSVVCRGRALARPSGRTTATQRATRARVSADPYTNSTSQHATELEPDTFANGSTVVAAFQVGRFFDGGGFLPGMTFSAGATSPFARVSDASVAYDAAHATWLISSIPLLPDTSVPTVLVNRSTHDGSRWATCPRRRDLEECGDPLDDDLVARALGEQVNRWEAHILGAAPQELGGFSSAVARERLHRPSRLRFVPATPSPVGVASPGLGGFYSPATPNSVAQTGSLRPDQSFGPHPAVRDEFRRVYAARCSISTDWRTAWVDDPARKWVVARGGSGEYSG